MPNQSLKRDAGIAVILFHSLRQCPAPLSSVVPPSLRSGGMRQLSGEQGKCAPREENQEFEQDGPPAHRSTAALGDLLNLLEKEIVR